jgi:N-methylhydantoinase B
MTELDPITLEIHWNRLISIADEAATGPAAHRLLDHRARVERLRHRADGPQRRQRQREHRRHRLLLLHPAATTKDFLRRFPAETWRPGDCVITNDPWLATGHLPDFTA